MPVTQHDTSHVHKLQQPVTAQQPSQHSTTCPGTLCTSICSICGAQVWDEGRGAARLSCKPKTLALNFLNPTVSSKKCSQTAKQNSPNGPRSGVRAWPVFDPTAAFGLYSSSSARIRKPYASSGKTCGVLRPPPSPAVRASTKTTDPAGCSNSSSTCTDTELEGRARTCRRAHICQKSWGRAATRGTARPHVKAAENFTSI